VRHLTPTMIARQAPCNHYFENKTSGDLKAHFTNVVRVVPDPDSKRRSRDRAGACLPTLPRINLGATTLRYQKMYIFFILRGAGCKPE
jgi:hypothetical protein